MNEIPEAKSPAVMGESGWLEAPRPAWEWLTFSGWTLGGLFGFAMGVWVSVHAWLSRARLETGELVFMTILGLAFAGAGFFILCKALDRAVRRTVFRVDAENLYREHRWWVLRRRTAWPRERICDISLGRSRDQVAIENTSWGEEDKKVRTDWFDLVLVLDDGTMVSLVLPCDEDELSPIYEALKGLLRQSAGSGSTALRNWGKPPGGDAIAVEEKPGWMQITLRAMPRGKMGAEYWWGLGLMLVPGVLSLSFVPDLLGYTRMFEPMLKDRNLVFAVPAIFISGTLGFLIGGAFIVDWARKRARTQHVITGEQDQLTVASSYRGKVTTRRFKAGEIGLIRREVLTGDSTRDRGETVEVITQAEAKRAGLNTPEPVCRKCGYDLRYAPEACPECGAKVVPKEVGEAKAAQVITCWSHNTAFWLEVRLNRWLKENRARSN